APSMLHCSIQLKYTEIGPMSQAPKQIVIRKYENRRLYDATNSRYVNLDDLAQMVRGDSARHQFLEWYLKSALDAYQKVSKGMEERWREIPGLSAGGLLGTGASAG